MSLRRTFTAAARRRKAPTSTKAAAFVLAGAVLATLASCAPEVGSERWCNAMREKPRGDWTANEALDFARHCLFETEE